MSDFEIRRLTAEEMEQMISNAVDGEGWTESYDVLHAFRVLDHDGFLGGFIEGKLIGHISCVRWPENYGFVGYYIVIPEYRGKGYGMKLWNAGMKHLEGCNVGLDGVIEEVPLYLKSGFKEYFENTRWEGISKVMPADSHIIRYNESMIDQIAEYDRKCFPSERKEFLKAWLTVPHGHSVVYMDNGVIRGYAAMHRTTKSNEIAPCFADNKEIAKALYIALINELGDGVSVHWNIPGENPAALELIKELAEYQVKQKFAIIRMYNRGIPKVDSEKIWSMHSYSIG